MKKVFLVIILLALTCACAINGYALTSQEKMIASEVESGLNALPPQQSLFPTDKERADEVGVIRKVAKKYGLTEEAVNDIYVKYVYELLQ